MTVDRKNREEEEKKQEEMETPEPGTPWVGKCEKMILSNNCVACSTAGWVFSNTLHVLMLLQRERKKMPAP